MSSNKTKHILEIDNNQKHYSFLTGSQRTSGELIQKVEPNSADLIPCAEVLTIGQQPSGGLLDLHLFCLLVPLSFFHILKRQIRFKSCYLMKRALASVLARNSKRESTNWQNSENMNKL